MEGVTYAINQWTTLVRFITDAGLAESRIEDERALRAVVIGRKNWLWFGPEGSEGLPSKVRGQGPSCRVWCSHARSSG
ncbi:MAG: transposase [Planctomycetota bacterium]